jgi:hypothetical protein
MSLDIVLNFKIDDEIYFLTIRLEYKTNQSFQI